VQLERRWEQLNIGMRRIESEGERITFKEF
jgi:hypothetical protein